MQRAIQVVWWIGLLGALIGTLVILKQVTLVVRALRDIQRLAEITRDAAQELATNAAAISRLEGSEEPARRLREAAVALAAAATSLEHKLQGLTVAPSEHR